MKSGLYFTIIIGIVICFFSTARAQEIVANSGSHFTTNQKQISWTIGEPVITTFSNENFHLTQGFHQTKIMVTAVNQISELTANILAYPNPTSDVLKVKIDNAEQQGLHCILYSTDGRMMFQKQIESSISEIPMHSYVSATYFLKVFDSDKALKIFKIIKE